MAFNPDKPTAKSCDFLLPIFVDSVPKFLGLSSYKLFDYGVVVMTGKEVTVNEVFVKLVDSGRKIENVDQTLVSIAKYFELLKEFKISNVLRLVDESLACTGYSLEKTGLRASEKKNGLP